MTEPRGHERPDHDQTLDAVHHAARGRLVQHRLTSASALLLGALAYWYLGVRSPETTVLEELGPTALFAVIVGVPLWLFFGRIVDRRLRALQSLSELAPTEVTGVQRDVVSLGAYDAERAWRFERGSQHLSRGDRVWLADGDEGPVVLGHGADPRRSVAVVWSRAQAGRRRTQRVEVRPGE